ncbi:MAG: hypothetical protein AAGC55_33590, partial [Myxococcota bacterium]
MTATAAYSPARAALAILAVAALWIGGCGGKSAEPKTTGPDHGAKASAKAAEPDPMLGQIPADTLYFLGGLEPLP